MSDGFLLDNFIHSLHSRGEVFNVRKFSAVARLLFYLCSYLVMTPSG